MYPDLGPSGPTSPVLPDADAALTLRYRVERRPARERSSSRCAAPNGDVRQRGRRCAGFDIEVFRVGAVRYLANAVPAAIMLENRARADLNDVEVPFNALELRTDFR